MPLTHLGHIPVNTFLRDYWQQKPLLIRNAFPDFDSPIDGDNLAGLALDEDVESRLVIETDTWQLQQGPFTEADFARLPASHWSLLVQAVDQWVPEVRELLQHFRFLPDWRLDDVMVSYATDGGGVGPHFDYYDVFLLQGRGRRRWRLGQRCDSTSPLREGTPLKLLKEFHTEEDWVLEPGDMLYVPPGLAHWGSAEGDDCVTYSIGFRAPGLAEAMTALGEEVAEHLSDDERYRDAFNAAVDDPGLLPEEDLNRLRAQMIEQITPERVARWFGRYMTEPKYPELEASYPQSDGWQAQEVLERHPACRMAWYPDAAAQSDEEALLFVDGEARPCSKELAQWLCAHWHLETASLAEHARSERDWKLVAALFREARLIPAEPDA